VTKLIEQDPQFIVHCLGPSDLQRASLAPFALLVFPGGSGGSQAKAIGPDARQKIREFVKDGGGYLGICAGAYLCSANYDWSLKIIDSKAFTGSRDIPDVGPKQMWYRGPSTDVQMELTEAGRQILGNFSAPITVRYHNGPIVSPAGRTDLPTYLPLATFKTETGLWEPQVGTMVETPAIIASSYGKGRVIAISPHPEATVETQPIVANAVKWLSQSESSAIPVGPESTPLPLKAGDR
jgi:putative intracellular protease/amidase